MKRISGTYFDQLIWNVLPYMVIVLVFIFIVGEGDKTLSSMFGMAIIGLGMAMLFWLIDTISLMFKKLGKLSITKDYLIVNGINIKPDQVESIELLIDKRLKWTFETTQLKYFDLTGLQTLNIISKPQFFVNSFRGITPPTLKMLFKNFPELEKKLIKNPAD